MIKLVLSTPRSGSTYYTESLISTFTQESELVVLQEWMLKLFKNRYVKEYNDYTISVDSYIEGSYHLTFNKTGDIEREYAERKLDSETEFVKWCNYLKTSNRNVVIHEHIGRLPLVWITNLVNLSDEVCYITRNSKEQISSYIIAYYTGVYICTANRKYCLGDISKMAEADTIKFNHSIVNSEVLQNFKDELITSTEIAVKLNLSFVNYDALPSLVTTIQKKFPSSYERLCDADKFIVNELCLHL